MLKMKKKQNEFESQIYGIEMRSNAVEQTKWSDSSFVGLNPKGQSNKMVNVNKIIESGVKDYSKNVLYTNLDKMRERIITEK